MFILKYKRLKTQYQYITIYLEELQEQSKIYNEKFLKEYFEINPQDSNQEKKQPESSSNQLNIDIDTELETELTSQEINESISKLYKKLSLKTHPDKGGDPLLFIKVQNAYKDNDILYLISIAEDYNIEFEITDDILLVIEQNIEKITKKIYDLQHQVSWLWNTADEETKQKFKLP